MKILLNGNMVQLRPIEPSEFDLFYHWATKSSNSHYWYGDLYGTNVPTVEEFKADWKDYYFDGSQPEKGRCFLILVDDTPIGQVNYNEIDRKTNTVELDILIGEDVQTGKGYGSDALKTLSHYLFHSMHVACCFIEAVSTNPRAVAAYKKAGFEEKKRYLKKDREYVYLERCR